MMSFGDYAAFLRDSAERARPMMGRIIEGVALACAEEAKDYIGHKQPEWADLADSTKSQKERLGFGRPPDYDPLLRTGKMRDSIFGTYLGTIRPNVLAGLVGSPSIVAFWQEMGTAKIPPRPFISKAVHEVAPDMLALEFGELAISLLVPV